MLKLESYFKDCPKNLDQFGEFLFDPSFKTELTKEMLEQFICGLTVTDLVIESVLDLVSEIYFALAYRPDLAVNLMDAQILNTDQSFEAFEQSTFKALVNRDPKPRTLHPWFPRIAKNSLRLKSFVSGEVEVVLSDFGKSTVQLIAGQCKCTSEEAQEILVHLVQSIAREVCEQSILNINNKMTENDTDIEPDLRIRNALN